MEEYLSTRISIEELKAMKSELAELKMIKGIYALRVRKDVIDSIKRIKKGEFVDDPQGYEHVLQEIARYYTFLQINNAVSEKLKAKIELLLEGQKVKLEEKVK